MPQRTSILMLLRNQTFRMLWFASLIALLLAVESTRFMDANICLDFDEGSEWCLHDVQEGDTGEPG